MLALIRKKIAIRSACAVIGISILLGSLFSLISYIVLVNSEQENSISNMYDLLNSVENTTGMACYLDDPSLANKVVEGLAKSEDIKSVQILRDNQIMAEVVKAIDIHPRTVFDFFRSKVDRISKDIYSPFYPDEKVCTIQLKINEDVIQKHSTSKAGLVAYLLLSQILLSTLVITYLVLTSIIHPIKTISSRLHQLNLEKGELLQHPDNKGDELGQLVNDVNHIISNLFSTLKQERNLRIQHALGEKKFQTIFDNAETGIFQMNHQGELISYNQGLLRILGLQADKNTINNGLLKRLEGQELRLHLMIDEAISHSKTVSEDFLIDIGIPGNKKWIHLVIHTAEEQVLQGLINDISERKQQEENANQLAVTDFLTGLHNRLGFEREMARLSKENARGMGCSFFVLMIDLDKFKEVNDIYGHQTGDTVLVRFSELLGQALRKTDFIARLGGDEFVILLRGLEEQEKAEKIAEKIIELASHPIRIGEDVQVQIGTSIGISYTPASSFNTSELLAKADAAMYEAKQSGRSAYRVAL